MKRIQKILLATTSAVALNSAGRYHKPAASGGYAKTLFVS